MTTPPPHVSARLDALKVLGVIGAVTCLTLAIAAALPGEFLAPSLVGIAILGLAWPWVMIGLALALDARSRGKPRAGGDGLRARPSHSA